MDQRICRIFSFVSAIALAATVGISSEALASSPPGMALLKQRCASCHDLTGPAPTTLHALWARKGPDLFYAGNKFQRKWLIEWLQHPIRIRPAGEFYADHITPGSKRDRIDPSTLKDHMALDAADAQLAADALMTLHSHDDLIAKESVPNGTISPTMGALVFDKFLGCMACHRVKPDFGGLSGPELYTAGKRLRARFMASYIRSPQAWDPKIWMPNKHLSNARIVQLVHYLQALSEGESNE